MSAARGAAHALLLIGLLADAPWWPSPARGAEQSAAFEQLLQRFAARHHAHASFTEVQQLALLKQPLQSSGELLYDAPDRLEKRTLAPRPEDLVLDHGVLTARRGTHTRVIALRDYPQAIPFVESIRATLAGDRAALERYFSVQFAGSLERWTLELQPVDPSLSRTVRYVHITGEQAVIHTAEIRQSDGDSSLLTIGPEITP